MQPVESSNHLPDNLQPNFRPTSDQTRQNTTNKNPGRNQSTKDKQPRNQGGGEELTKEFPTSVDRNPLRNKEIQKQQMEDEAEHPAQEKKQKLNVSGVLEKEAWSSDTESVDRFVVTEEHGLKNTAETVLSTVGTGVPEQQSPETQLKLERLHSSFPKRSGPSEKFHDQSICEPHKACPECPASKTPSVPEEMWVGLEKTIQDMLQGLVNKPGFVVEISRIFSEILISLHRWTLDLENTLKHGAENESSLRTGPEPVGHGFYRELNLTDKTQHNETGGPSCSSPGRTKEPSSSKREVCSASEDYDVGEESRSSKQEESGSSPTEKPDSHVNRSSEEVVFIETHFAEPLNMRMESRSDLGLRDSLSKKPEGPLVRDLKDLRGQTLSTSSNVGQSSGVKRLIEVTAEELRAIAVPELALLSLQEGKRLEESSTGPLEEVSARDMDSCEEADEEEEEEEDEVHQQAAQSSNKLEEEPECVHLDQRKDENPDCRVS